MERWNIETVENAVNAIDIDPISSQLEAVLIDCMKDYLEYRKAEEQGLLLRLPCRVGDKVYKLWNCGKNGKSIAEFEVKHIDIDFLPEIELSVISTKNKSNSYWFCKASDIGKTVFLTRAEAEKALEEMEESKV